MNLKSALLLLWPIYFLFPSHIVFAQPKGEDIILGQSFTLSSEILGEERPYFIYLPENYQENGNPLSVMYLLDGHNNFHPTTGIIKHLNRNGRIPNMMVVGIPNTTDRTKDLTPAIKKDMEAKKQFATAGGADNMLAFIKDELIPHIDKNYNTGPFKILTGHSFGGIFAVNALLSEPDLFDAYLSISPSMWWDKQNLVARADSFLQTKPKLDCYFYMTMGDEGNDMLGGAMKLAALFEEMEEPGLNWDFKVMKEETHGSIPHRSTYYGLEAIFKDWFVVDYSKLYAIGGMNGVNDHYAKVSEKLGYDLSPSETDINNLGYVLLANKNIDGAIAVFLENIKLFPKSANVYDSAGEAYMEKGENDLAIKYYKESMLRNPGNMNGITMLEKLGVKYDPKELEVKLSQKEQNKFTGSFEVSVGGVLTIHSEDGKLIANHPGIPTQTMLYFSDNLFLLEPANAPMKFTIDKEGALSKFEVQFGIGNPISGKKIIP